MSSLRGRLTRWLLTASVPLVVAVEGGLYLWLSASMHRQFDEALRAGVVSLVNATKLDKGQIEFDIDSGFMSHFAAAGADGHDEFFQLWTITQGRAGREIARSGSLGQASLPSTVPDEPEHFENVRLGERLRARAMIVRFVPHVEPESPEEHPDGALSPAPPTSPEVLLIVAKDRRELDRALATLASALIASGAVLTLGLAAIVGLALQRGLRPVQELAIRIEGVDPVQPRNELRPPNLPDELVPIATRTSELLDRVAVALERERRFAAGAAHQLRTPIAEIRALAELALSRDRSPADYQQALDRVLTTAKGMQTSVHALLKLAHVESGREKPQIESIDVGELLRPLWASFILPLARRGVKTDFDVPAGATVQADRAMLATAMENVLSNAAEYTPDGGRIACRLRPSGDGHLVCELENTFSPAVSVAALHEGVFLASDAHPKHHLGIGLPLARALIAACGGQLNAGASPPNYRVQVDLRRHGEPGKQDANASPPTPAK